MDHKRKEELKKNDLADIIEHKLTEWKPLMLPVLLVGVVLLAAIGGISWYLINQHQQTENTWSDLYAASYQLQKDGKTDLLESELKKSSFAATVPGLWAKQMLADNLLQTGLRELSMQADRKKAIDKIDQARKDYQYVSQNVDREQNELLWSRSTMGLARAAESLGNFDEAKQAYESVSKHLGDSPLGKAAGERIQVLENPINIAWYDAFKNRKPRSTTSSIGEAPLSDPGLPRRPDFSYPELIVPNIGDEAAPAPPGASDESKSEEKKAEETKADETKVEDKKAEDDAQTTPPETDASSPAKE
jgi:hypothetical protein